MVDELSSIFGLNIKVKVFEFNSLHEAACARLYIFEYEHINMYSNILYLDADIVIQNDITQIFDLNKDDRVYAIQEYDLNGEGHGGWFFDYSTVDRNTPGINSGVLLFRNTPAIRKIFAEIKTHISNLRNTNSLIPMCMDQPFILYHLFKNSMYESQIMRDYVFLSECNPPPDSFDNYPKLTFCHFTWPIGDTYHKKQRMIKYVNTLLDNYTTVCKTVTPFNLSNILNKKYTWTSGFIHFKPNNSLETSWVYGHYNLIGHNLLKACWYTHGHYMIYNEATDTFISFLKECIEQVTTHEILGLSSPDMLPDMLPATSSA